MATKIDGRSVLSDVTVKNKYAAYLEEHFRREDFVEVTARSQNMHKDKFPSSMHQEIEEAFSYVGQKKILQSMRSAQFAGKAISAKNNRIFNCAYSAIDCVTSISEVFYNLLCGSGVGFSVQSHHIQNLPPVIKPKTESREFWIQDTIEGWCDAVQHLMRTYTGLLGKNPVRPVFRYDLIRPEGSPLKTSGGKAPGPEPLRVALGHIERILSRAVGRKLRSIEVYDILCHMADAVHSGGIRRAAMICFFDRWDRDMLLCKSGNWWENNLQRSRSNNSAVFVRGEVTRRDFFDFWEIVKDNRTGEPAIYWTWDRDVLANPCVEISLHSNQFCNLSTVNGATCRTEAEFIQRVVMAARIGTYQASYTDFSYLRPVWREVTEREALLGVSITGIGAGTLKKFDLHKAAAAAVAENRRVAKQIGINPASRVTCVKPEGTGSLVLGTPPGIHSWHAPYYWRTLRFGKNEAIYQYLADVVPELVEDEIGKEDKSAVFRVGVEANPNGLFRQHERAIDLLERVKRFNVGWIRPGHIMGRNTHNISCTVNIRDDEWEAVGDWMWENREYYNGIATLPYDGGNYKQAPFSDCTKEEYQEHLPLLSKINLYDIVETEDNTNLQGEIACAGGACLI